MSTDFPRRIQELFLPKRGRKMYTPLRVSDEINEKLDKDSTSANVEGWHTKGVLFLIVTSTIVAGAFGFALGYHSWDFSRDTKEGFLMTPGNVKYSMIYNRTYTREPSPESNAAWDAMFPLGVGFVKHPKISPNLSGIAVFHELHCVNMLRVGYYAALNGNLADMQNIHDHNKRPDPHHLRHCFDYLRQSLMCAADTNLEPVDFELGGVTGWKFERTCRNFEQVKAWADHWHSWDSSLEANA